MKKLLFAGLLAVIMMLAVVACGKDDDDSDNKATATSTQAEQPKDTPTPTTAPTEEPTPTPIPELTKERYDAMSAEELLAEGGITDYANVTVDQCVWLIETFRFADFRDDKGNLNSAKLGSKCPTSEAIKLVRSGFPKKDDWNTCMGRFFDSQYAGARAYGFYRFATITGLSEDNQKKVLDLIAKEEEPVVILQATEALKNDMAKNEIIRDFILRASHAEDYMIRNKAANALGCTASIGVPGVVERITEMMKDEHKNVRTLACTNCGHLADPSLVAPLKAVLDDPNEDAGVKAGAVAGLAYLCYDYPMHENVNEEAWNVLIEYFSKTPRGKDAPIGSGLSAISRTSEKTFAAWKEKATYYNAEQLFNLMVDIIEDADADYLLRTNAVTCAKTHGTAEQFASLAEVVNGLTDNKAEQIQKAYNDAVAGN